MTTLGVFLTCWRFDGWALLLSGAAIVAYLMSERGRRSSRVLAFGAAVFFFVLALSSPIGVLSDGYLFSAHMLKKLLLVLIVPPLALMGLAPRASGRSRLDALLMRPIVTWGLGVSAMWLWHAPTLCDASASIAAVARFQEISLVVMGAAFFRPIVGPNVDARLPPLGGALYLFTACVACTLLGVLVTFSPVSLCSVFLHPNDRLGVLPLLRNGWGMSPERDQQIGGLFMWVPACLVYGAGILGLLGRWYRADSEPTPRALGAAKEAS